MTKKNLLVSMSLLFALAFFISINLAGAYYYDYKPSSFTHCDIGGNWGWRSGDSACPFGYTKLTNVDCRGAQPSNGGCYVGRDDGACYNFLGNGNVEGDECCFYYCSQKRCDNSDFGSWGVCVNGQQTRTSSCNGQVETRNCSVNNTNFTSPNIVLLSPINSTYNFSSIQINASADQNILSWIYNVNSGPNLSFVNGQFINFTNGSNLLKVYGTNANGTGSAIVSFFISQSNQTNQTNQTNSTLPIITVYSPIAGHVYNTTLIWLNVSSNQVVNWTYSLNNGVNVSFQPNITFYASSGWNTIIIYATNINGTSSTIVSFRVNLVNCNQRTAINDENEDATDTAYQLERLSYYSKPLNSNYTINLSNSPSTLNLKNLIYWIVLAILILIIAIILVFVLKLIR